MEEIFVTEVYGAFTHNKKVWGLRLLQGEIIDCVEWRFQRFIRIQLPLIFLSAQPVLLINLFLLH